MTTTTVDPAARWLAITEDARRPSQFAAMMIAVQHAATAGINAALGDQVPWYTTAYEVYTDITRYGLFDALDRDIATPVQIGELVRIQRAGDKGAHEHHIDGTTRGVFVRRGWITVSDKHMLHLTFEGEAQLAAAVHQPWVLSPRQALALRKIMEKRASPYWADNNTGRIFVHYNLVREDGTLTPAGHAKLENYDRQPRPEVPTPTQAKLLREIMDEPSATRRRVLSTTATTDTYEVCEALEWVRYGDKEPDGRAPLFITAKGREAYEEFQRTAPGRRAAPAKRETKVVGDLVKGDRVRLARRYGWRGLSPDFVTVDHVQTIPRAGNMPGGHVVWVEDAQGSVIAYAERHQFHRNVKFEIEPAGS